MELKKTALNNIIISLFNHRNMESNKNNNNLIISDFRSNFKDWKNAEAAFFAKYKKSSIGFNTFETFGDYFSTNSTVTFTSLFILHTFISLSNPNVDFFSKWIIIWGIIGLVIAITLSYYQSNRKEIEYKESGNIERIGKKLENLIINNGQNLFIDFTKEDYNNYNEFVELLNNRKRLADISAGVYTGSTQSARIAEKTIASSFGNNFEAVCRKCGKSYGYSKSYADAREKINHRNCSTGGNCIAEK
jgi:hypothetical protein